MRAANQVSILEGRELSDEEIATLDSSRGISAPQIKSIRQTHRRLAQLLAVGTPDGAAASIVGLHPSRVSILKSDPAFQALMSTYHQHQEQITLSLIDKLGDISHSVMDEIRDRLLEEPEKISNSQLLELLTESLDRLGHSPTQKIAVAHVDISELRKNATAARGDQISFRNNLPMLETEVSKEETNL